MTELESKIWDTVHKWCDGQYHEIPDQNRRYLMDEIKALVLSNVSNSVCPNCGKRGYKTDLTDNSYACKKCLTWWANGC